MALDLILLATAAGAAFWPVLRNGFVNWDDPTVLLNNPHLVEPGVITWALSTTLIGHYQPLAWLLWSAAAWAFGVSAAPIHAISLALHVANGMLVYGLVRVVAGFEADRWVPGRAAALAAALVFLLHPTSVESVAWASAFPYVASVVALLCASIAYVNGRRTLAVACYAASLLTRATALGFPLVLLAVDIYPLARHRRTPLRRLVIEKLPFAALALAAALVEWHARDVATLQEVGIGPRLTLAATAPFAYAARIVWPVRLSPLDPLPIAATFEWLPLIAGLAGVMIVTAGVWAIRRSSSLPATAWFAYLVLLAPVAGLTPSGLQATADRYLYVPSVVFSIVAGVAVARTLIVRVPAALTAAAASAIISVSGVVTWQQTHYWRDSIALWTRAVELDPHNDVATYNLAVALADAGREDDAMRRYEETLALVPDHDLARRHLSGLQASQAEREADRLASAGRLDEASEQYARALALDGTRLHARTARGMTLVQRGRFAEGAAELRRAITGGAKDVEAANALAYALTQTGDAAQAAAVLARALNDHPDNVNVKHNLARLLATADDPAVRDAARALRLAQEVCEQTGNRDPRALDTLAAAYAAAGQLDAARQAASNGIARARELGDERTAAAIAAHAAALRR